MGNWSEAAGEAVKDVVCGILGVGEAIDSWWAETLPGPYTTTAANQSAGFRRGLCDDPNPNPGPGPEFPGGQCPGTGYRYRWTFTFYNAGGNLDTSTVTSSELNGPIVSARATVLGPGNPNFDDTVEVRFRVENEAGQTSTAVNDRILDGSVTGPELFSVNGPDDCGDGPTAQPSPYQPITNNTNITYIDNTMNTVNEGLDITLLAPIFIGGAVYAPVNIETPDFNIRGYLDVNGDITFDFGGGTGNDTSTEGDPDPLSPEDEPEDEPSERRIIGAIIDANISQAEDLTLIPQTEGPDLVIPDVGTLSFFVSGGKSGAWTPDIRIKNRRCYIPCPAEQGALNVQGTARPQVTLKVTPVFRNIEDNLIP